MTDTQARRRALLSLLDQFPLERDLYLYEGRREVSPRDEFADKIEALFMPEGNASIATPEGQRDYYRDLVAEVSDENKRLARDLAEYEAYDALPSLFQRVMEASPDYVTRFKGKIEFQGAVRKMYEEMREFEDATAKYVQARVSDTPMSLRLKSPEQLKRDMLEEFIDFMVTAGGVFNTLGIRWEDIEVSAQFTLAKLGKRTTDTHAWNEETKTVERIGKAAQS